MASTFQDSVKNQEGSAKSNPQSSLSDNGSAPFPSDSAFKTIKKKLVGRKIRNKGTKVSQIQDSISREDNVKLFELHMAIGCHWKQISEYFPNRSDNQVKNVFFAQVRKSLRKARRFSSKASLPDPICQIKPKVLSNFLLKDILLPEHLWIDRIDVPWLESNPVNVRQFILFFAFSKGLELISSKDVKLTPIIDFILTSLEKMNSSYCEVKEMEFVMPAQSVIPTSELLEGQSRRTKMLGGLGSEFGQLVQRIQKEVQGGSSKDGLLLSFKLLAQNVSQITSQLSQVTDFDNETQEFSKSIGGARLSVAADEGILPPGLTSLTPAPRDSNFQKLNERSSNPAPNFDELLSFIRPDELYGRAPTRFEEFGQSLYGTDDTRNQMSEEPEITGLFRDSRASVERASLARDIFSRMSLWGLTATGVNKN